MALRKILAFKAIQIDGTPIEVRVYKDSEWGEYRARLYQDGKLYEPADAFDGDLGSILDTAASMCGLPFTEALAQIPLNVVHKLFP